MRHSSFRSLTAATLGFLVAGTNAQTGSLTDLGTLLKGEQNLTSFYSYIKEYPDILLKLPNNNGTTILAPNNDAFDRIKFTTLNAAFDQNQTNVIKAVLDYHILRGTLRAADLTPGVPQFPESILTDADYTNVESGQKVTIVEQSAGVVVLVSGRGSRSTLIQKDLAFSGGIVQVIDNVNVPPVNLTVTSTAFNLTAFQGALYASSQIESFNTESSVTIFAPNNDAFAALGPAISNMTVQQLSSVLNYHLIPDRVVYSTALTNGTRLTSKNGANMTVAQVGNNLYVNSAQVITRDVLLANGVLHVLANVLNPQEASAQPNSQQVSQAPVFASASQVYSLPYTSAIPCTQDCPAPTQSDNPSASETGSGAGASTPTSTRNVRSSSSQALGASVARETGFGVVGVIAAIGGVAAMVI